MSIEGGGSGGSGVGVAASIGPATGVSPSVSRGSLGRFGPSISGPEAYVPVMVKEGPVGLAQFKNTMSLQIGSQPVEVINFQKPVEALDAQATEVEAENILAQAKTPVEPAVVVQPAWEAVLPQPKPLALPIIEPLLIPDGLKDPLPQIMTFPALEPAIGAQSKTEVKNATRPAQAVAVQPALQEQEEEVEEIVEEKVQKKHEEAEEEEEIEESTLKDVVDEKVLNIRLEEFGSAADLVGAEAAKEGLEEIDGEKIVKHIPAETESNRSGLIKKRGPDGSREEAIELVSSKKFRSINEAKEKIAAIIAQKVPVKRAKGGRIVGYEAVARVLKYFFIRVKPAEQLVARVVKKQRSVPVVSVAKPEVKESRIEDLGLAEVFPKAA